MPKITRQEIFAQAAKKLRQDFQELSTVPHAGLKGQEAEDIIRKFLKAHIPARFDVGSGFIIDNLDNISRQTDVIIYDALHCPKYRASENAAIIPSDNAATVIEVKSSLDKSTMEDAFIKTKEIKALAKTKPPDVSLPFPVLAQTYSGLFAFSTSLKLEKLQEHYTAFTGAYGIGRHIDIVAILDKGIMMLAGKPQTVSEWAPLTLQGFGGAAGEGAHIASCLVQTGDDTLDMFLRFLLPQLIHFRGMVGHPGFMWVKDGQPGMMHLTYLTSVTNETDPALRAQKLQEYRREVEAQFAASPLPKSQKQRGRDSTAEPPEVIHLPPPSE